MAYGTLSTNLTSLIWVIVSQVFDSGLPYQARSVPNCPAIRADA